MGNEERIRMWLEERESDTGDILYFMAPECPKVKVGIVHRMGRSLQGHQHYAVMPVGACYYEDLRNVLPLKVMHLDIPPVERVEGLRPVIEKQAEEKHLRRVK